MEDIDPSGLGAYGNDEAGNRTRRLPANGDIYRNIGFLILGIDQVGATLREGAAMPQEKQERPNGDIPERHGPIALR